MDLNQVYTAPAIPKLGRRNIKSALITGAIKPQIALNKTKFSFVNPKIGQGLSAENLGPTLNQEKDTANKFSIIESFLGSTNKILVQVQNQLALDHLSRIAAEKSQLEKDKKRISRKKVSDKEKKLEEPGKNGILPKIFDRVTAPIKSIFQKLIDFFSIILTGLIVNNAFNWLSKKENREKLKKFFDFVVDHWKEILIILGTAKLLSVILKVVGAARALKGLIDLFKKKPPVSPPASPPPRQLVKPPTTTKPTTTKPTIRPQSSPLLNSQGQPLGGPIKPSGPLVTPSGTPLRQAYPLAGQKPFTAPSLPKGPPPKLKPTKLPSGLGGSGGGRGAGAFAIGSSLYGLTIGPEVTRQRVEKLKNLKKTNPSEYKKEIQKLKENAQLEAALSYIGSSVESISILESLGEKYKTFISPLGMSGGGTVGKGDRPGTDTVPAMVRGGARVMLDEGEEVIKASESMRWRPLLKDINNGGREWIQFVEGIKKQESTNTVQAENNTKFSTVLEDYDKVLKEEERRLRKKYNDAMMKNKPTRPGGGGGAPPAAPILPSSTSKTSGGGAAPAVGPSDNTGAAPAVGPSDNTGAAPAAVGPSDNTGAAPAAVGPAAAPAAAPPGNTGTPRKIYDIPVLPWPHSNNSLSPKTKKQETLYAAKKTSMQVINIPETLPPITQQVGNIPSGGGDPTPLPNISSINPLYGEDIVYNATALGIC